MQRLIPIEIVGGIALGIGFGFNALEFMILAVVLLVLFTVETINTAIEEVNDLVTLEENPREALERHCFGQRLGMAPGLHRLCG